MLGLSLVSALHAVEAQKKINRNVARMHEEARTKCLKEECPMPPKLSYEVARADYQALQAIGDPDDMTGGFNEGEVLFELLHRPTKAHARNIYLRLVSYWFEVGVESGERGGLVNFTPEQIDTVLVIAKRHKIPATHKVLRLINRIGEDRETEEYGIRRIPR